MHGKISVGALLSLAACAPIGTEEVPATQFSQTGEFDVVRWMVPAMVPPGDFEIPLPPALLVEHQPVTYEHIEFSPDDVGMLLLLVNLSTTQELQAAGFRFRGDDGFDLAAELTRTRPQSMAELTAVLRGQVGDLQAARDFARAWPIETAGGHARTPGSMGLDLPPLIGARSVRISLSQSGVPQPAGLSVVAPGGIVVGQSFTALRGQGEAAAPSLTLSLCRNRPDDAPGCVLRGTPLQVMVWNFGRCDLRAVVDVHIEGMADVLHEGFRGEQECL